MSSRLFLYILLTLTFLLASCEQNSNPPTASDKKQKAKPHLIEFSLAKTSLEGITQNRTGTLRARNEVKIYNQEEGKIIRLPFYEGDIIKKGELIAQLDDSLLRAQLERVRASRIKAESDLSRIKRLRKEAFLSEEELIKVETELAVAKADEQVLETRLSYANITAPFNGVLTQRLSEVGNVAERFTHLLTIADPTSLVTEVSISELLINQIKLGDESKVQIDALGAKQFIGRINRIFPSLNPVTRRGTIEIELEPVPAGARPGQLCRVEIQTQATKRLLIPLSALRRKPEGEFVFILDNENKTSLVPVTTGLHLGENVEILSGIQDGDKVVTKGFLGLKPGKTVSPVNSVKNSSVDKGSAEK